MSSQDALWRIPETLGWWWYGSISIMAGAAALIMIFKMILRHPFDALLVARCMIVGGLVCFAYRSANSGLSEIGIGFTVTGSLFTSVLVATNCVVAKTKRRCLCPIFGGALSHGSAGRANSGFIPKMLESVTCNNDPRIKKCVKILLAKFVRPDCLSCRGRKTMKR